MKDNDILIARQEGGTRKTVVVDGDTADCERVNRQVRERTAAEAAKKKQHEAYLAQLEAEKKARSEAECAKRRKRKQLTAGLILSVAILMALTLTGLMHEVVGMAFLAGDAAAFGWFLGRNG